MSGLIKDFELVCKFLQLSTTTCLLLAAISMIWLIWAGMVFWILKHEGDGRERFLNTIKNVSLGQFYRDQLGRFLDYTARSWFRDADVIADRRSQLKPQGSDQCVFGANIFTEPAFVFSLKLALFYPILSVFLFWVISGTAGNTGGLAILPELSVEMRVLFLVILLITFIATYKTVISQGKAVLWWLVVAVASGVASVGVAIGAGAGVVAHAGVFVVVFVGAVAGAIAGAIAIAGAVAFAFTVAFTLIASYLYFSHQRHNTKWFWLCYLILVLVTDGYLIYTYAGQYKANHLILMVFYSILPILNAPLDWLSTAITRSLLYAIAYRLHSGLQAFVWAVLDLLIALVLLVAITCVMTIAISAVNQLAITGGGKAIIDLTQVFISLFYHPLAVENWWIYVMLLSTLLPTLLHMLIAGFSVILWIPEHWLKWVADGWKPEQHKANFPKFLLAWGYFTVVSPLALIAPFVLLGGSIWLLLQPGSGDQIGKRLLNSAYTIASSIDSSLGEISVPVKPVITEL